MPAANNSIGTSSISTGPTPGRSISIAADSIGGSAGRKGRGRKLSAATTIAPQPIYSRYFFIAPRYQGWPYLLSLFAIFRIEPLSYTDGI